MYEYIQHVHVIYINAIYMYGYISVGLFKRFKVNLQCREGVSPPKSKLGANSTEERPET